MLFSVRPDRRILRETPGDTGGGDPPPSALPTTNWSDPGVATTRGPVLEQELVKVRREAAAYRVGNRGGVVEANQQLHAAAGLTWNPESPTPIADVAKKLRSDTEAAHGEVRSLTRDLALERTYRKLGLDSEMTAVHLQLHGGLAKIDKLDASSESYADDLEYAVQEAAADHAALRGQSTMPRRTSAPMTPPGGGLQQLSRADLESMSGDEIDRARRLGLTDEILGRGRR